MDEQDYLNLLKPIFEDDNRITMSISIRDLWFIDSVLALGWRHPDLSDHQKNWMEHIHFQLEEAILAIHPEAKELFKAGWDTAMDVPLDRERTERINEQMRTLGKKYLRKTGRI